MMIIIKTESKNFSKGILAALFIFLSIGIHSGPALERKIEDRTKCECIPKSSERRSKSQNAGIVRQKRKQTSNFNEYHAIKREYAYVDSLLHTVNQIQKVCYRVQVIASYTSEGIQSQNGIDNANEPVNIETSVEQHVESNTCD